MKNNNMFIDLDNIDVETIERIEFKYEKGNAYAIVYHVYKHIGIFLTKVSIDEAEKYLEEDEDLLRSYSYEGNSVSEDMYYKLISQKISNAPVDTDLRDEEVIVEKTDEEKREISEEILDNIHKKQREEEMPKKLKETNAKVGENIFMADVKFRDLLDKAWGVNEEIKTKDSKSSTAVKTSKEEKNSKSTLNLMASNLWNSAISGSPEEMDNDDPLVKSFDAVKDALSSEKEEKKEVIVKDETKLTGVVVYTAINRENKIVNRAMMIYSDGTIKNVNEKIFTDEIAKEARNRGYSDYNKLVDDKFLIFTTVEQMVRDWDKYFGEDTKVVKNKDTYTTASVPITSNAAKKQPVTTVNTNANTNTKNNTIPKPVNSKNSGTTNTTTNNSNSSNIPVPTSVNGKNIGTANPVNSNTNTKGATKPSSKANKTTKAKKQGVFSRVGGFLKRHIGPAIAILVAGVVAISGIVAAKKLKEKNKHEKTSSSYTQMDDSSNNTNKYNNDTNTNTNTNNLSAASALDNLKDKNSLRYEFLKDNTKDLNKYNSEIANQYYEASKGTRLAHSFDETISEYIVYNNLTEEELSVIFGNDKLDSKVLNRNFKNAIKEDGQLHNLQTHSVARNELFKTQEGRNFYKKYSDLFTSMNKASVNETKVEKLEKFYDMLRDDFDFSTIPSGKDSYKLSVLEYISAAQNIDVNVNIENELNSSEKAYFDKLESFAETKINNIVNSQNAKSNNGGDANLQVSDYKNLIEDDLKSKNLYDLNNRDVSNYDSYKAHTIIRVLTTEKEEEKEEVNQNTNTIVINDDYDYNNVYIDDNDYGEAELIIGDDETELTIGDQETELFIGDDYTSTYTIETEQGTSELTIDTENNTAEIVLDDFVNDNSEISLDDFSTQTTEETESYTVYIDGVLDENGNLPDYYKSTTSSYGAVSKDKELPDPNSITDEQLEAMMSAQDNSDTIETPKVLKLR